MSLAPGKGFFNSFEDVFILDGLRTPMVGYLGAFADANPIDPGIKAARSVLARAGVIAADVDSVISGNMAPGGFDQIYVARHTGLSALTDAADDHGGATTEGHRRAPGRCVSVRGRWPRYCTVDREPRFH